MHLTAGFAQTLCWLAAAVLSGAWGAGAWGQVIEVNGGASSLYQTQGGSILVHGAAYESEFGAGLIAGRLVAGGRLAYRDQNTLYSAGVEEIRFDLPTDLFNADHRLLAAGIDMKSVHPKTGLELFAGGTSQRFDTPLFTGIRVEQPAAALVLQHAFSPSLLIATHLLAASHSTALQAVQWRPRPWLKLAATGGFGGTSHYEALSADLKRPLADVKAAFINAPADFQRLGSHPDISPEPIHENLLCTVRSSARNPFLTVTGGRQSFMVPASSKTAPNGAVMPTLISTSNQIGASTSVRNFALAGTAIKSSYGGNSNLAFVLSASAAPSQRLRIQTSYLQSRFLPGPSTPLSQTQPNGATWIQKIQTQPVQTKTASATTNTVVTSLQEALTRRYGFNQAITYSNGQTSIGYGGSIASNLISLSADYETFYVPTRPDNPFQQSLVVDLQLTLFGRITLHGGTFVSPVGKLLYTANARAIQGRSLAADTGGEHVRIGMYIVQGRVVDANGDPLPGAAIGIGQNLLFTDSAGEFFMREKRAQNHTFQVLVDQFLDGHNYEIVSQPTVVPSIKAEDQHLLIIVKRIGDRAAAAPETSTCPRSIGPQKRKRAASHQPGCDAPPWTRQEVARPGRGGLQ